MLADEERGRQGQEAAIKGEDHGKDNNEEDVDDDDVSRIGKPIRGQSLRESNHRCKGTHADLGEDRSLCDKPRQEGQRGSSSHSKPEAELVVRIGGATPARRQRRVCLPRTHR